MYAGHTRVKAARLLGMTRVPARFIAFESEERAIAFGLADNRANEWAAWDVPSLTEELNKLDSIDIEEVARATGFEQEEIEGLRVGYMEPDAPEPPGEFPEVDEDISTEHRCPRCGYEWSGKARN
jgi:ParB-like chromosome segregation protein Spo0J